MSLVCVETRRKSMHISSGIGTATTAGNSGESNEDRGLLILAPKEGSCGDIRPVAVGSKDTMSSNASGVDRALGDLAQKQS